MKYDERSPLIFSLKMLGPWKVPIDRTFDGTDGATIIPAPWA